MEQFRFLQFQMYRDSIDLLKTVRNTLEQYPKQEFSLRDQTHRAMISVILNIAEGSGKNSDAEFRRFLSISLGSLHELFACFDIAYHLQFITHE